MATTDLLVQVELPALGVRTQLKFGADSGSLGRISEALLGFLAELTEELADDLLLNDSHGTALKFENLQKAAAAQLAAWEARLAEAEQTRLKGDRATQHMMTMRTAYLKELNNAREQLHQKDKAAAMQQPFIPDDIVLFDPTDYVVDDEKSELCRQKATLVQEEHRVKVEQLQQRNSDLSEQVRTKALHLQAKDKLIDQLKLERDRLLDATSTCGCPGMSRCFTRGAFSRCSTEDTSPGSLAGDSLALLLAPSTPRAGAPDADLRGEVRDVAVGTDPVGEAARRPECRAAAAQCDLDGRLLGRAMELLEQDAEATWGRIRRESEEDPEASAASWRGGKGEPDPDPSGLSVGARGQRTNQRRMQYRAPSLLNEACAGRDRSAAVSLSTPTGEMMLGGSSKVAPRAAAEEQSGVRSILRFDRLNKLVDVAAQVDPEELAANVLARSGESSPQSRVVKPLLSRGLAPASHGCKPVAQMQVDELLRLHSVGAGPSPPPALSPTKPPSQTHLSGAVRRRRAGHYAVGQPHQDEPAVPALPPEEATTGLTSELSSAPTDALLRPQRRHSVASAMDSADFRAGPPVSSAAMAKYKAATIDLPAIKIVGTAAAAAAAAVAAARLEGGVEVQAPHSSRALDTDPRRSTAGAPSDRGRAREGSPARLPSKAAICRRTVAGDHSARAGQSSDGPSECSVTMRISSAGGVAAFVATRHLQPIDSWCP